MKDIFKIKKRCKDGNAKNKVDNISRQTFEIKIEYYYIQSSVYVFWIE